MRDYADIKIYRGVDGSPAVIAEVPITPGSVYRWKLMEEDSYTLSFYHPDAIEFSIGDYIDDELFGKFFITESSKPTEYDRGAYKYELRFDREYIGWKNKIFQLTTSNSGEIKRTETGWSLTDTLEHHVQEIIRNLLSLGYKTYNQTEGRWECSYKYCIDGVHVKYLNADTLLFDDYSVRNDTFDGPEEPDTMLLIQYSGTDIYSAIKDGICKAYRCEFWVDGDVLCLGKCMIRNTDEERAEISPKLIESSNYDFITTEADESHKDFHDVERRDFKTADVDPGRIQNAEKVVANVGENEYANRLYAYGSTRNVPDTYRKSLIFTCDKIEGNKFQDSVRYLYPYMVKDATEDRTVTPSFVPNEQIFEGRRTHTQESVSLTSDISVERGETITLSPFSMPREKWPSFFIRPTFNYKIYSKSSDSYTLLVEREVDWTDHYTFTAPGDAEYIAIEVASTYANGEWWGLSIDGLDASITIRFNGSDYSAKYDTGWITFVGGFPSGFSIGSQFTIAKSDLNMLKVKSGYYTSDYSPTNQRMVGEQRLMLPISGSPITEGDYTYDNEGYIGEETDKDKLVEKVVFFEGVFPRCALRITSISRVEGNNTETTYSDGSSSKYKVTRFTIKAMRITPSGDVAFPFDQSMILSGQTLQIKFLTRDEEGEHGAHGANARYLLAGMTFDVRWNQTDQSFTIKWNQDYGAQFPNDTICPSMDDPFILLGWNVKALEQLDIVRDAEVELTKKAIRYSRALMVPDFTFDCSMMSQWAVEKGVLPFGQAARVHHGDSYTDSRVIGFELKADIPEDTPRYTIGETEAYSRLRELNKLLGATESSVSTSGSISEGGGTAHADSSDGGGTNMLTVWQNLTNDEGLTEYNETTEIDINHIPTIPAAKIAGSLGDSYFETVEEEQGQKVFLKETYDSLNLRQTQSLSFNGTMPPEEEGGEGTPATLSWDDESHAFKVTGNLYATGWITGGGINPNGGGGGGVNIERVWQSFTTTQDNSYHILHAHLPTLSVADSAGMLVGEIANTYNSTTFQGTTQIRLNVGTASDLSSGTMGNKIWSGSVIAQYIAAVVANATSFKGGFNATTGVIDGTSDTLTSIAEKRGWVYTVTTAGTFAGQELEVGDSIIFKADCPEGTAPTSNYVIFVEGTVNVDNKNATLALNATTTLATVEGVNITAKLPSLYVARTAVSTTAANATLLGVDAISNVASSDSTDKSRIVWEPNGGGTGVGAWHFLGNIFADGWITGGGINPSGGGEGVNMLRVWQDLTNNPELTTYDDNTPIAAAHIPIDNNSITIDPATGKLKSRGATVTLNGNETINASFYAPIAAGNQYQYLMSNGSGAPTWQSPGSINNSDESLVSGKTVYSHLNSNYLPLSAGSGKPLTGDLYAQSIIPKNTKQYSLGDTSHFWNNLYLDKVYIGDSNTYLVNDGSGNVRIVLASGKGLWTDGFLTGGGINGSAQTIPRATLDTIGISKPDGTSLTVNSSSVLSITSTYINKINAAMLGDSRDGLTPPKKIIVCTNYPSSLEADALYLKVTL